LLIIAKEFGRRHDTVLRSIDDLIKSGHIGQHEFVLTNYLIKTTAKRYQYSGNIRAIYRKMLVTTTAATLKEWWAVAKYSRSGY